MIGTTYAAADEVRPGQPHVGASMAEPPARRVGGDRLGLPSDHIPLIP